MGWVGLVTLRKIGLWCGGFRWNVLRRTGLSYFVPGYVTMDWIKVRWIPLKYGKLG
ncbi:hypothetical protein [Paenibacillus odorifer]|uniref:hypothetical protein n=1 Tax=Paenibacillus odorifer TaxID=189426 RepID=UPI0015C32251|nr:hypothetical protein [Paenibacillus odorifer]